MQEKTSVKELRKEIIEAGDLKLPIILTEQRDGDGIFYGVEIDGVEWFITESSMHAVVMFEMLKDHVTEYMHYEKK